MVSPLVLLVTVVSDVVGEVVAIAAILGNVEVVPSETGPLRIRRSGVRITLGASPEAFGFVDTRAIRPAPSARVFGLGNHLGNHQPRARVLMVRGGEITQLEPSPPGPARAGHLAT
jgi:hypothetical protein